MKVRYEAYGELVSCYAKDYPRGTLVYSHSFHCACVCLGLTWFPLDTSVGPVTTSITGYLLRPGEEVTLIQE